MIASVREQLQAQLSHFFVDEFQDTDPLQVEILLLLCADDPAATDPQAIQVEPGKLFVVGDPKQAIYRFRRADIALYEAVKQRLVAGGAKLLHLTTSFRSVPAIQSAVNAAFEPVMRGNGQAHYVPLENNRPEHASQPAVIALPVPRPYGWRDVTSFAIEASYPDVVAAFVEHLTHESRWTVSERGSDDRTQISERHVCLMFRRFQSFGRDLTRPYVRALEARGIPHVLVGGRSFHEREEIEAVRNALRAIEWPDDELSVYGTLRGPLFAFHDEDLVAFIHVHRRLHPLHALVAPAPDVVVFREIRDALAIVGSLHLARNRRPIADTIARLLSATRAHAGIAMWPAGEQALANIFRVMDLARGFEASGATSFRAFVDRLGDDADRGRQPDAPVVEEGTEGVRIMTVHAAKGLEFPVVVLCDPTAPLGQERPSRHIDVERRVWLEPLAGCIPIELREHKDEVLLRDREEGQRLAYVAMTRARDLVVVPVVGDEERPSWLEPLWPVVHPHASTKRSPAAGPGCPPFGDDSVIARSRDTDRVPTDSVAPGLHVPRAGTHGVVWWDPAALRLDRELGGGLRQRQILQADESHEVSTAGELAYATWQARHNAALGSGAVPSLVVYSVTEVARTARAAHGVKLEHTNVDRAARPNGRRFGSLVHAILAAIDLRGDDAHVRQVGANQARLLGASDDEIASAVVAVRAALLHPLLVRAAASPAVRRETSVAVTTRNGLVEGVVDLAFVDGSQWTVVDFKTDLELGDSRARYEMQVRLYADAIAAATSLPAIPVLFMV